MTTLTLPAATDFRSARFRLVSNTQHFSSPLSGAVRTVELLGARWAVDYELKQMERPQAALWQAFFTKLRGRSGRFYAYDPLATTPRGAAPGTPTVSGADQTGAALVTAGWSASTTNILRIGDYIAFDAGAGRELHMVVADANSDGSGNSTLTIEPPIRNSPSNGASVITSSASCIMALEQDDIGWDEAEAQIYGFSFSAIEVFT